MNHLSQNERVEELPTAETAISTPRPVSAAPPEEDSFRVVADDAPVLMWLSGLDKGGTWFNRRWLEFVGRSLEAELGNGWTEHVHPDDRERCYATYVAAFNARAAFSVEYRMRRHDGVYRSMLDKGNARFDATGAFAGYVGTCVDVTEWRQSVDVAEQTEARYRTLTESIPHLVWTCLPDGWCDYLGRQWVEYTGIPEERQLGYAWTDQLHPEDRQRVRGEWALATTRAEPYDTEFRIRRGDGVYRWFKTRAVPLYDAQRRIVKWFGSNTDFEEYKLAERRLESNLERFRLLDRLTRAIGARQDLKSMFDVVLTSLEESLAVDFCCVCFGDPGAERLEVAALGKSSQGRSRAVNLKAGDMVNVAAQGLAGCLRGQLCCDVDTRQSTLPFARGFAAAGLQSIVLAPLLVESHVFGVLVAARLGADAFSGLDCEFLRQLSEHVGLAARQGELHRALQQAYDDLRQSRESAMQHERLRALGQMAAGVAHNINNAICPVAIYTDALLEDEGGLSDTGREYLETIQRAIRDVAMTVAGMREFSRPHEPERLFGSVSLNEIAQQAIDFTRARWCDIPQQRGVTIEPSAELAPEQPLVVGLATEIREALINLIFNAVDAMPDGGHLTLRTYYGPGPEDGHGRAYVEVVDDGVGMDQKLRLECLDPFVTTKGEWGTGLGLAMVYGVVQRHDGSLDIQSEPAKGTRVRLGFPRAFADGRQRRDSKAPLVAARRLRILVIDDDELVLKVLANALRRDGHAVVTADSGQDGIEAFESALPGSSRFDVVITDLGMPHLDGNKVARAVKRASPGTPVVLFTGWGQSMGDGSHPHVDIILSKPPRLGEIRDTLQRLVLLDRPA